MRFRHSHPFWVEWDVTPEGKLRERAEKRRRHTFNHLHECEEGDAHVHKLGAWGDPAIFPLIQRNRP